MQKRILINLVFLIWSVPALAQSTYLDSLLKVADTAKVDTIRFDAWQELGTNYMESDPAKGIQYGKDMLELSTTINDSVRIGFSYQLLGVCYDYKNNLDSCFYYLRKADTIHIAMN